MADKKSKKIKNKKKCTYIGGQAVLEGVMMAGKTCQACAVRDPDGEIQVEAKRIKKSKGLTVVSKIPFLRGIVNLVTSLVRGTKTLMRSAAVYGDDEGEAGRVQKWLAEKFKLNIMDVVAVISAVLGIVLAVAIFMLLPNFLVSLICKSFPAVKGGVWQFVLLGVFKLSIFIIYLAIILFLKDIRRLYRYHGAEHKTINAYEHGVPLVPEEVMKCSRIHDRCGTSFLFIVIFINIIVLSLVTWALGVPKIENGILEFLARVGVEIALLPVIAGISYEILKFLARFDNKFVLIFKAPGMLIQKLLTTREPDAEMVEVAIAAFKRTLEMDADETVPESEFVTGGILSKMLEKTKAAFREKGIDESDAEWIYSINLGIKRSMLKNERVIKPSESKKIAATVEKRLEGRPLWYIIGDTDFCGCKIKVDERALIPRPETEILADAAIKTAEEGDKILDMCTGSGCIAVAIAKACADKNVTVTGADVSEASIMLAEENAKLNGVKVNFVKSDMFSSVRGKYNMIVCNPPYVKSGEIPHLQREVLEYEPRVALDGGADGLDFYRQLSKEIKNYIAKGGMLLLECGEGQTDEIIKMFPKREYAMVMKDFAGVERFIKIAF